MMLQSKLRDLRKKHESSQKELAEKLMTTQVKVAAGKTATACPTYHTSPNWRFYTTCQLTTC